MVYASFRRFLHNWISERGYFDILEVRIANLKKFDCVYIYFFISGYFSSAPAKATCQTFWHLSIRKDKLRCQRLYLRYVTYLFLSLQVSRTEDSHSNSVMYQTWERFACQSRVLSRNFVFFTKKSFFLFIGRFELAVSVPQPRFILPDQLHTNRLLACYRYGDRCVAVASSEMAGC